MSSYFKNIDIFGTRFEFTTFTKSKFRSVEGAVITLICYVIILIFSFFFGRDFYLRINPRILYQIQIPVNYSSPFLLDNTNMFIAWRISSYSSKTINHTGIVYPKIIHYSYDNVKNELIQKSFLNYTKCSDQKVFNKEFAKSYNPDIWYCIDWPKDLYLKFGGYWDNDFINYFEISLLSCPEKDFSKGGCTSMQKLKDVFESQESFYFDMVYPEYNFVPNDIENPLIIEYKNYYYPLNFNLRKKNRMFMKKVLLNDDLGRMFEDFKPKQLYSYHELLTDYFYFRDEDYGDPKQDSTIYTMFLYFRKPFDSYNRSFMKIQDLAAIVGGFLKIVLLVGSLVSDIFSTFNRDEILYNQLFKYQDQTDLGLGLLPELSLKSNQ
jgi:hypothetical protein